MATELCHYGHVEHCPQSCINGRGRTCGGHYVIECYEPASWRLFHNWGPDAGHAVLNTYACAGHVDAKGESGDTVTPWPEGRVVSDAESAGLPGWIRAQLDPGSEWPEAGYRIDTLGSGWGAVYAGPNIGHVVRVSEWWRPWCRACGTNVRVLIGPSPGFTTRELAAQLLADHNRDKHGICLAWPVPADR